VSNRQSGVRTTVRRERLTFNDKRCQKKKKRVYLRQSGSGAVGEVKNGWDGRGGLKAGGRGRDLAWGLSGKGWGEAKGTLGDY